jgi:transposase
MKTGAIIGATIQEASVGDTTTINRTLTQAFEVLVTVLTNPETKDSLQDEVAMEVIADKGYHSNETLEAIESLGRRSYISEPNRGKRRWSGEEKARDTTSNNRARMRREKGKALMRKRGELIERSFAHTMESGAMRRAHLRGHENIMKWYHLQTAALNLGLVMRSIVVAGTPKGLHEKASGSIGLLFDWLADLVCFLECFWPLQRIIGPSPRQRVPANSRDCFWHQASWSEAFSTACWVTHYPEAILSRKAGALDRVSTFESGEQIGGTAQ